MSLARLALALLTATLIGCGSSGGRTPTIAGTPPPRTPPSTKSAEPQAKTAVAAIPAGRGRLAAMSGLRGLTLRDRPGGRVIAHLKPETAWGSPTVVWAMRRRGPWLGVVATALPNNRIGWLDVRHDRPRMWRSPLSLVADLSQRTLELRRGSKVVRRMHVTVGGPASPTPIGRFAVTDKLIPNRAVSYYGCCLLALSGHQPNLRPGWAGGNRIAIHGGPTGELGTAASAGCLRAGERDLKALMKVVPIGTPVYIRR